MSIIIIIIIIIISDQFLHISGILSITEAIFRGVPMIVIPFMVDQIEVRV